MRGIAFSGLVAFVFLWAVVEARGWPFEARLFPWIVGLPMLFLALFQVALDWRGNSRAEEEPELSPALVRVRTANILAWMGGFFLSIWLIGFSLSVAVFLFLYLKAESGESWATAAALTLAGALFFYALFERMLHLPLPQGQLFAWLGF
jgi:hypothetical protein